MQRFTGRLLVVCFALAMLARLARIFVPHHPSPSTSKAHAVADDTFVSGEVVAHARFADEFVLRTRDHADTRVRIEPRQTRISLGSAEVRGDSVQVGDHATVGFSPGSAGLDPRPAHTIRLARAPAPAP